MSEKTRGANRSKILRRVLITAAVLLVAALFMAPVAAEDTKITASQTWEGTVSGCTIVGSPDEKNPVFITVDGMVLVTGTITIESGYVTIKGTSNDEDILKRNFNNGHFFSVPAGAYLTVDDITIDGGAIWVGETDSTLNRGTTNNGVSGNNMFAYDGQLAITDCILQNHDGGHVFNSDKDNTPLSTLTVTDSTVIRNNGGISWSRDTVNFSGTELSYNSGDPSVFRPCSSATYTISNCDIHHNAGNGYGAILGYKAYINILDGTKIHDNTAKETSGAIYYQGEYESREYSLTIKDSSITNNVGKTCGGVQQQQSNINLDNVVISGNSHTGDGGGDNFYIQQSWYDFKVSSIKDEIYLFWYIDGDNKIDPPSFIKNADTLDLTQIVGLFHFEGDVENDKAVIPFVKSDGSAIQFATVKLNGGTITEFKTLAVNTLPTPTKYHYTFEGWYTDETLADPLGTDSLVAADTTYYAKWTLNAPQSLSISSDKASITTEETATLTALAAPEKPLVGYYEYQWYTGEVAEGNKAGDTTQTPIYQVQNLGADTEYICTVTAVNGDDRSEAVPSEPLTIIKADKVGIITISGKQTAITYGDTESFPFTYTTNIEGEGKILNVASSNAEVAAVSGTGSPVTVTILGVGETEISVSFVGDKDFSSAKDNFTMKVSKGEGIMTLKPVVKVETFVGGGMVNLTVDGAPNEGVVTVTHNGVVIPKNADGTYSATLPNEDGKYTFKATYSGDKYQVPEATCKVTVKKLTASVIGVSNAQLKPQVISTANETALDTAIAGTFKDKFSGKTDIVYLDVSLLINGVVDHDKEVTFIIGYESLGIDASKWAEYEFVVLHIDNDGNPEIVKAEPKKEGLQITSTCSPFAIGYNVKKTDNNNNNGGNNGTPQGSTVWLTETPTPTPTEPTQTETVPTETATPTQTETESPLSVLAVVAGLGAVVALRRRYV